MRQTLQEETIKQDSAGPSEMNRRQVLAAGAMLSLAGCSRSALSNSAEFSAVINFEPYDPAFFDLVDPDVPARLLGQGYLWAEGPSWDAKRQSLYFTDVPANRAYRWSSASGLEVFLDPSGIAPDEAQGMREPGANGLLMGQSGELLICNHGMRAVEAMNLQTRERRILANEFEGKRFNSPNDLIQASDGTIYFSDPPYGLEGLDSSPLKQMVHNGVYRLSPDGAVDRIIEDISLPNGVALSPDQSTLYVAQSDPKAPLVYQFDLIGSGGTRTWFDVEPFMAGHAGLPDGMAVTRSGYVFLAGPGGVLVIDPNAKCLGRIGTGRATANCAIGEDGRTLFVTAQDRLLAVGIKAEGIGSF